jgi:hypothetical protein
MSRTRTIFARGLCLLVAAFFACTNNVDVAGTSEVGNPQKVSAVIVDPATGLIVAGVPLILVSPDYNPVKDVLKLSKKSRGGALQYGFADTSDQFGRIEITVSQTGNFNLVSMSDAYKYRLFKQSLTLKKNDSLGLDTIYLHKPGNVLVSIDSSVFSAGSRLIIPGTGIVQTVNAPGVVSLEAPAGILTVAYVDGSGDTVAGWSKRYGVVVTDSAISDVTGFVETLTIPFLRAADSLVAIGEADTIGFGGAVSNKNFAVLYQVDWGDGAPSPWSAESAIVHSWSTAGSYSVRVRARSTLDTTIVSSWSLGATIDVRLTPSVSAPAYLTGDSFFVINTSGTFTTGGSISNRGDSVMYGFFWGDGGSWSWSTRNVRSHSWSDTGDFTIAVMARSARDTAVVSSLSRWKTVTVIRTHVVTAPSSPTIQPEDTVPAINKPYTLVTGNASSNLGDPLHYRFSWRGNDTGAITVYSPWTEGKTATMTLTAAGIYSIVAYARSSRDTTKTSRSTSARSLQFR